MTGSGRGYTGYAAAVVTLGAIYIAASTAVHFGYGAVASWWPAAGLSVGLLALTPRAWWPALATGIVVTSGLANVTGGREVGVSVCFGLANAAEAVIAGWILRGREDRSPRLLTLDDYLRLVRAAALGAVAVATGAATTVAAFATGDFADSWLAVFASHGASTLVVVPVAMAIRGGSGARLGIETLLQVCALVAVTLLVFSAAHGLPLAFAPLPLLVWAALRFDIRVVTLELVGLSVLGTTLSSRGLGPFGAAAASGSVSPELTGTMTQIWLLSAAVMSLPLTVAIEQRRQLIREVTERGELFRRNFIDSLTAMIMLRPRGDRLEIVDANGAALRLLGDRETPVVGRYLDRVLAPTNGVRRELQRVVSGELDGWRSEVWLADSPTRRVAVAVSALAAGSEHVFAAQLVDVSVEHHARTRIEAAERLTSTTLETTAAMVLLTDLEGHVLRVNAATCEMTGYTEDELLSRPVWDTLVPPELVETLRRRYARPDRLVGSQEASLLRRNGERLTMLWKNNLVRDAHGRPQYVVLTGLDVTRERQVSGLVTHLLNAAISTALVVIDPQGRIQLMNSGTQRLLGYETADVVGRPFVDLLAPEEVAEHTLRSPHDDPFAALVETIGAAGESRASDWRWVAADGTRHTMSMTLSVAASGAGGPEGFLCVGRDVTEERRTQEVLIAALERESEAVEQLRRLDHAKNDFVSTVSHELRTPVTSIMGYTEMLRDGEVVDPLPQQEQMLGTIARNCERLIAICNDLLTLGGMDAGATAFERDHVDLCLAVDHVAESIRPLAAGRGLLLEFEVPSQELLVVGDRLQLERAITNLLSNAVKFTEDGGEVCCRLEKVGNEAVLTVADTGMGIPADEQDGLFQKFFRSSTAQARAIPGTGLGLSIVARIVEGHGGSIEVESEHGAGTTFTVRLPAARA